MDHDQTVDARRGGFGKAAGLLLGMLILPQCGNPLSLDEGSSGGGATGAYGDTGSYTPDAAGYGAPGLCRSSYPDRPGVPVLATIQDHAVVTFDAAGTRRTLHQFPAELDQVSLINAGAAWGAVGQQRGKYSAAERDLPRAIDIRMFSGDGKPLWQHQRQISGSHFFYGAFVNDCGAIAVGMSGMPSLAVLPDGSVHDLPGMRALAAPDAEGWVPVSINKELRQFGFMHGPTGILQRLTRPLLANASHVTVEPLLIEGRFVYLGAGTEGPSVVDEARDGARTYPIDWDGTGLIVIRRVDTGALVQVDGAPSALWRSLGSGLTLYQRPAGNPGSPTVARSVFFTAVVAKRALVTRDKSPIEILDLDTGGVRPVVLDPAAAFWPTTDEVVTSPTGKFFLGIRRNDSLLESAPLWRVDATNGTAALFDVTRLAPLRPITGALYCAGRPSVADDGRIAMALRDDLLGGIFTGGIDGSSWTRIGNPVSRVITVSHNQAGPLWIVEGETLQSTYCPSLADTEMSKLWPELPAGSPALKGDSFQIIPPSGPVVTLPAGAWLNFQQELGCGVNTDGTAYDFIAGTRMSLGAISTSLWLPRP